MTDPERKPDLPTPEGATPTGNAPDWTDAMTGPSLRKESRPTPTDPFTVTSEALPTETLPPGPAERQVYSPVPGPVQPGGTPVTGTDSKKIVAGILGILLGSLGVHKFYLGINQSGFILLGATLFGAIFFWLIFPIIFIWVAGLIGLIEGIIYLTKTDEQFRVEYEIGKKPWF